MMHNTAEVLVNMAITYVKPLLNPTVWPRNMLKTKLIETELSHIEGAIIKLEEIISFDPNVPPNSTSVMRPDYWRTRIQEVLSLPHTSFHIREKAKILLMHLDRIDAILHNGRKES